MKKILVTNHKGGVGKTTVSDELAFALERMDYDVCFTKLDPQRSSHEQSIPDKNTDYQVIDTPPTVTEKFKSWCNSSDVIILPTRASIPDWSALKECYDNIVASGTKAHVGIVVNFFDGRRKADRDFIDLLSNLGLEVWATLPQSTSITRAQAHKVSVIEAESSSIKNKPSEVFNSLAQKIVKEF